MGYFHGQGSLVNTVAIRGFGDYIGVVIWILDESAV
jgi:hypothetical protein